MVLSNHLLYSHSRADQNATAVKKFEVKEGDVIKVRYEPRKVTFISRLL